jgi:hypothetical protein
MEMQVRTDVGHMGMGDVGSTEPVRGVAPARTLVARMKLALVGMLVGLAGFTGLALVEPATVPLDERIGGCALLAALAGVVVVFSVARWKPEWLPAWIARVSS